MKYRSDICPVLVNVKCLCMQICKVLVNGGRNYDGPKVAKFLVGKFRRA